MHADAVIKVYDQIERFIACIKSRGKHIMSKKDETLKRIEHLSSVTKDLDSFDLYFTTQKMMADIYIDYRDIESAIKIYSILVSAPTLTPVENVFGGL